MRRVELESALPCSVGAVWAAVQRWTLLGYVTHPLLKIMPLTLEALPNRFCEGTFYTRLYLFGFLPLGRPHHPDHQARRRQLRTADREAGNAPDGVESAHHAP